MKKTIITLSAIAIGSAIPALAQTHHGADHHGQPAATATAQAASPSTQAYRAANARMHADMDIDYSGNADTDFARGMIPHHQAAVEMARIQLKHGTDPELRRLSEEIIKAQEAEIAFLQDWLKKNAGR